MRDQSSSDHSARHIIISSSPSVGTHRPIHVVKLKEQARRHLPAAAFVLKSQKDATDVALQLNAAIDSVAGDSARWVAADVLKERGSVFLSPAEKVGGTRTEENAPALS